MSETITPSMIPQWRKGFVCEVSARLFHDRVESLTTKLDRIPTASEIVRSARSSRDPLHIAFNWDDESIGEKHRTEQADDMSRALVWIEIRENVEKPIGPVFVRIREPESEGRYVTHAEAMDNDEFRAQALRVCETNAEGNLRRAKRLGGDIRVICSRIIATIESEE